jgi:hypothetical protein
MYFGTKSYLKSNRNHTDKQVLILFVHRGPGYILLWTCMVEFPNRVLISFIISLFVILKENR